MSFYTLEIIKLLLKIFDSGILLFLFVCLHFCLMFSLEQILLVFFHSMGELKLLVQQGLWFLFEISFTSSKFISSNPSSSCYLIFNPIKVPVFLPVKTTRHVSFFFVVSYTMVKRILKLGILPTYFVCKVWPEKNSWKFLLGQILHCKE